MLSTFNRNLAKTAIRSVSHAAETTQTSIHSDGHYDIIIVGGGAAGLSLAGSIAKNRKLGEKKVLLLDGATAFKGFNDSGYSNRVFAINHNTVSLLKAINAWDTIKSIRCRPVHRMQVWESFSDALITFGHANPADTVAYIVENDVILHAILKELEHATNITIKNEAKIDSVLLERDGAANGSVQLKTGETFTADLLVGADGANSIVRKQMDVNHVAFSYDQMGLIATVELDTTDANFTAWQRFLPKGVIALLPLSDKLSSIVWSTDATHFKHLMKLDESEFIDAVNNAFTQKFAKNTAVEFALGTLKPLLAMNGTESQRKQPPRITGVYRQSRAGFPLGFGHASSYVGKGVALIGDAAHRVHPLAGMGLNLGFGDVKCLTDVLANAVYSGSTLNNGNMLRDYESARLRANVPIMLGIHGLQRLYSTDLSPIIFARTLGLHFTQQMAPLKKFFMEKAMG